MRALSFFTIAGIAAVSMWVASCSNASKTKDVTNIVWKKNDYATLFKLGTLEKDTFLEVYNNDSSVLGKYFWGISDSVSGYQKINRRNRIVCCSGPYNYMLTELGLIQRIVAVDNLNYIGHPAWLTPASEGQELSQSPIAESCKKPEVYTQSGTLSAEKLLAVKPDLVINYWTNPADQEYAETMTKKKIPFIWCQNWLENHPLGRSEWLLAFGWLTGTSQKADSIYTHIKNDYIAKCALVKSMKIQNPPAVAANVPYPNGTWFLPVKSDLLAQMVLDAGGRLIALDKDKSMAITPIEKAIALVKDADVWINVDMYSNAKSLLIDQPSVASIRAFKNQKVYHYNAVKNNNRNPFWDRGNLYCNLVLNDLITLFSKLPNPEESKKLQFYRSAF